MTFLEWIAKNEKRLYEEYEKDAFRDKTIKDVVEVTNTMYDSYLMSCLENNNPVPKHLPEFNTHPLFGIVVDNWKEISYTVEQAEAIEKILGGK